MDMMKRAIEFIWNAENKGFKSQVGESHAKTVEFLEVQSNETGFEGVNLFHYLKNEFYCKYVGSGIYKFIVHEVNTCQS